MKNLYPRILYFSKRDIGEFSEGDIQERRSAFSMWLSSFKVNYDEKSFPLYEICELPKRDNVEVSAAALKQFISTFDIDYLPSLVIVVDYLSFIGNGESEIRKVLRELIVEYPEVKFVFDEFDIVSNKTDYDFTKKENDTKYTYLNFLELNKEFNLRFNHRVDSDKKKELKKESYAIKVEEPMIHCFKSSKDEKTKKVNYSYEDLKLLLDGNSNLFDVSNLRNTIKSYFFSDSSLCMDVNSNYYNIQKARSQKLVLCVEEERSQALFNSYALYANGYRVRIINSVTELVAANELSYYSLPQLIVRDYDLQFEDKQGHDDEVYKIRGIKDDKLKGKECLIKEGKENRYWYNLRKVKTYFVTQASRDEIDFQDLALLDSRYYRTASGGFEELTNGDYRIYGLKKPINGINDFQYIPEVKKNAEQSIHTIDDEFYIKRLKVGVNSGHSASPFIYHIAESLINRAGKYNEAGRYLLAAVLSREALEVLNGFHKALMWEAMHINAVAENALIMNQIGCDDRKLSQNLRVRLNKITDEVKRIGSSKDDGENIDAGKNVLLQIHNDIRATCRSREHFESADVALKEMIDAEYNKDVFSTVINNVKLFFKASRLCRAVCNGVKNHQYVNYLFLLILLICAIVWNCLDNSIMPMLLYAITAGYGMYLYKGTKNRFKLPIWFLLALLVSTVLYNSFSACGWLICLPYAFVGLLIVSLLVAPMQFVYGLATTRGNISKFILMLFSVMVIFSGIYLSFLYRSGISYGTNVPHIVYNMFDTPYHAADTIRVSGWNVGEIEKHTSQSIGLDTDEVRLYRKITPMQVFINTAQTTLEQGATDFFSAVATDTRACNMHKKRLFKVIMLLHVFISWIFLGVFISMLYQKYRRT